MCQMMMFFNVLDKNYVNNARITAGYNEFDHTCKNFKKVSKNKSLLLYAHVNASHQKLYLIWIQDYLWSAEDFLVQLCSPIPQSHLRQISSRKSLKHNHCSWDYFATTESMKIFLSLTIATHNPLVMTLPIIISHRKIATQLPMEAIEPTVSTCA